MYYPRILGKPESITITVCTGRSYHEYSPEIQPGHVVGVRGRPPACRVPGQGYIARKREAGSHAESAHHDGGGTQRALLHGRGTAAAAAADQNQRIHLANRARLRGARKHAAPAPVLSRLFLQGGRAESDQPGGQGCVLGGGHHPVFSQLHRRQGVRGSALDPDRAVPVPEPSVQDNRQGLPGLPQHAGDRAQVDDPQVRRA